MIEKVKLESKNLKKWFNNLLLFFSPVAIVYLLQVTGFIVQANGAFNISYLQPTQFTQGAMVLYLANSAIDYLRKLRAK